MANKQSFILYMDMWQPISGLSMEQRGKLLTGIYEYENGQDPDLSSDPVVAMAFSFIRQQLDRDSRKYESTCEKRREAGKLGGRPQKADAPSDTEENEDAAADENQAKAKKANGFSEKQTEAKKANGFSGKQTKAKKPDNDTDNDNDNDTDTDTDKHTNCTLELPRDAVDMFERVWELYPNKKGKNRVTLPRKRWLYELGEDQVTRAISRYKDMLAREKWRHTQDGGNFFMTGIEDYLDGNYQPEERKVVNQQNSFHNFHQRNYDYDQLERDILAKQW